MPSDAKSPLLSSLTRDPSLIAPMDPVLRGRRQRRRHRRRRRRLLLLLDDVRIHQANSVACPRCVVPTPALCVPLGQGLRRHSPQPLQLHKDSGRRGSQLAALSLESRGNRAMITERNDTRQQQEWNNCSNSLVYLGTTQTLRFQTPSVQGHIICT